MKSMRKGTDVPTSTLAAELTRRLDAASEMHIGSIDALREAVCAYLDDLRVAGLPRERALEAVREVIAKSQAVRAAQDGQSAIDERIVARMSRWCVDHWAAAHS
jgi:hypothetical protein